MARKQDMQTLLYLLTIQFLVSLLSFYSGVIFVIGDDAYLVEKITDFFGGAGGGNTLFGMGVGLSLFALISFVAVWGAIKRKGWAWKLGLTSSVALVVLNLLALVIFGFEQAQLGLRLSLSFGLSVIAVYLLTRPNIHDHLSK